MDNKDNPIVPIVGKPTEEPDGFQILLAIDQLANALLGGWADETISSRAYRLQHGSRRWNLARLAIDALFFWQPDHCYEAYMSEVNRKQQDPELRVNIQNQ
jgi:hypothetical protein